MAEHAGESERAEKGDDRRSRDVRERERAGARLGWAARPRNAGASMRMGRAVGPSRREKGEGGPRRKFLFFFFKNVNSFSICLFQLKFYRAPKIVKY
jgi:hypothetical protein